VLTYPWVIRYWEVMALLAAVVSTKWSVLTPGN